MKCAYEVAPEFTLHTAIMGRESFHLAVKVGTGNVRRKAAHISLVSPCTGAQV